MTTNNTVRDLLEPVPTLADLADYLHVPVQTLDDLRPRHDTGTLTGACVA